MVEVEVPNIRIRDLLALSGNLQQEMVDQTRMQNRIPAVGATLATMPGTPLEFATPLQEVEVVVMGRQRELGLLDEGSEIVIVRKNLCNELELEVNRKRRMTMQIANGGKEELQGCVEYLELEVGGVKTYAYAFVVQSVPYRLLLGRLWQKGIKLGKIEQADGSIEVEISDLGDERRWVLVPTRERVGDKLRNGMLVVRGKDGERRITRGGEDSLIEVVLTSSFVYDSMAQCLAYKWVAIKVRPVPGTMLSDIRIVRQFPEDPLETLLSISPYPSLFVPGTCLTKERIEGIELLSNTFLWPEERQLVAQVLQLNEKGLVWDKTEKGRFRENYFSPVKIPVQEHMPWAQKTLPIPLGIYEKVIELIRRKVDSGVYETSYSSYRHQWFTVAKKDESLHIVHNLTPLNAITVRDSQEPPLVYLYAEQCSARSIYLGLDLFVGYDYHMLAEESRNYTTFDTPLGTMCLIVLPQGWTGSVGIFHNDIAFIPQHETDKAPNFLDDITLLGPKTRYERKDGTYEVLSANPGIRRFVWEHTVDLNCILHCLVHAGATVLAKKLQLC